jgi:mono/diheme cytochrome c family protein/uncharacterized membrane protein
MTLWLLLRTTPASSVDWALFIGRFHPLLVHLPIGFLLAAGLLEAGRRWGKLSVDRTTIGWLLLWSALGATVSCIVGYLLSLGGGYDTDILTEHQWQGIGVAVFSWLAWVVQADWTGQRLTRFYLPLLTIALVLLGVAGHHGGSLTHGSDYLTQYAPQPIRTLAGAPDRPKAIAKPITDVNQALVYAQIVDPILQSRCTQCHNAEKAKGGLRLDSPEQLKKGGEDGPVLAAGSGLKSALVGRCLLPESDDDHMPPKGKPQLTDSQLALLTWWIDQGASFDKRVADLPQPEKIRPTLASLSGNSPGDHEQPAAGSGFASAHLMKAVPPANPQAVTALKKSGLLVLPLAAGQNQLEVSAVNTPSFSDAQAALLPAVKDQLVWLKLGDTPITDAALTQLAQLANLQKLHLEHTRITDAGLKSLSSLPQLEYLNLYATDITDAGLTTIATLPALRSVYLWQTRVTPAGIATLQRARPDLLISSGTDLKTLADFSKPQPTTTK